MVNRKALSELSDVAQRLNAKSDTLNTHIQALNEQLRMLNLSLEYWLDTGIERFDIRLNSLEDSGWQRDRSYSPPRDYRLISILGYSKMEDEWQLAVRQEIIDSEWDKEAQEERWLSEYKYMPLLKASRDLRLRAVDLFHDLTEGLKELAESKLAAIHRAEKLAKAQ